MQVRLAHDRAARPPESLDDGCVVGGGNVGQDHGARGGDHPLDVDEVFDGHHIPAAPFIRDRDEGVELAALPDPGSRLIEVHRIHCQALIGGRRVILAG